MGRDSSGAGSPRPASGARGAAPLLDIDLRHREGGFELAVKLEASNAALGLFGPSGAGKTSLLRLIAGLARPREGSIRIAGETLFDAARGVDLPPERRRVGMVFQESRLFPHLTVDGNLRYGYRRLGTADRRIPLEEVAAILELAPLLERRPRHLSGGERQRVALGRALLASPRMLLLDEPLASLDQGLRGQILPYLVRARERFHIPLIYVSHILAEIEAVAGHVAVLDGGRLLGAGPIGEILHEPAILELAARLGLDNIFEVEVEGSDPETGTTRARLAGQILVVPILEASPGTKLRLQVSPTDVILARQEVEGISARNQLRGSILTIDPCGDRLLVTVDVGLPLRAVVTPLASREMGLEAGLPVRCLLKALALRVREGTTSRLGRRSGSDLGAGGVVEPQA
ncbi:MAG: molybdenum ABC transporter ATP-binding protein [Planctomycetota bacterium]